MRFSFKPIIIAALAVAFGATDNNPDNAMVVNPKEDTIYFADYNAFIRDGDIKEEPRKPVVPSLRIPEWFINFS